VALSVAAIRVLGKAERQARCAARRRCATVWLGRVAFAFLLFGAWQLAAGTIVDATYVGRPTSIVAAWWGLAASGTLWQNAQYTLFEFIVGFAAGALAGICVAVALTLAELPYRIFEPFLLVVYGIPMIVLGPLLTLWFGTGLIPKIALAALATFLLVVMNTVAGIRTTSPQMLALLRLMGAKRVPLNLMLILPHALPYALTALRLAIPLAMVGTILGEFLGATHGLGHMIEEQASFLAVDKMMAGVATIALAVIFFRVLLTPFEKWVYRY
jgi:NitT/TauT family transport system permease protein